MAKLQIIVLFSLTILLTLFFEKSKAFPETWVSQVHNHFTKFTKVVNFALIE